MNSTDPIVWQRRECVSAEVEGSLVLLDLDTLVYHSLNRTASAIWTALEEPSTADAVAGRLQERFEVEPEHCARSVEALIAQLATRRLVSPSTATSTQ